MDPVCVGVPVEEDVCPGVQVPVPVPDPVLVPDPVVVLEAVLLLEAVCKGVPVLDAVS